MDGSTVKRWLDSCESTIEAILEKKLLPFDTSESRSELKNAINSQTEIYIDGTEQPIRRPQNSKEQKDNYSGKKKKHTSKILILTNQSKEIIGMTPVYVGKSHDFSMFKKEEISDLIPPKTLVYVDTGFEGIDKLVEKSQVRRPKKKPKLKNLFLQGEMIKPPLENQS